MNQPDTTLPPGDEVDRSEKAQVIKVRMLWLAAGTAVVAFTRLVDARPTHDPSAGFSFGFPFAAMATGSAAFAVALAALVPTRRAPVARRALLALSATLVGGA